MGLFHVCLLILLYIFLPLFGKDLSLNRNQFYIGPEWYRVERTKHTPKAFRTTNKGKGGAKQYGDMIGIRIGYDRLKRYGWYIGADALYAKGTLKGHTGNREHLRSYITDLFVEGRVGYTFQQKCSAQLAFTPYVGGGYFIERNNFVHPSPLTPHYKKRFSYVAGGFLLWVHPYDQWEIGLNFKAKYPVEPRCRINNIKNSSAENESSETKTVTQKIDPRWHYRIDFPITYRLNCRGSIALSLIPFYEYREYGFHFNYPFNFMKTQFYNKGLTLEFLYRI